MINEPTETQDSESSDELKKRKLLTRCLMVIVILIALVFIGTEGFVRYNIAYAKKNPTLLPSSFAGALQRHDHRTVKALTSPTLWPKIEEWMNLHEPVKCSLLPRFTLGDEGQGGGIVTVTKEENKYVGHQYVSIVCPDPKHYYCLEVAEILVKREGEQWVVAEVGEIEEYWSQYNCHFR